MIWCDAVMWSWADFGSCKAKFISDLCFFTDWAEFREHNIYAGPQILVQVSYKSQTRFGSF